MEKKKLLLKFITGNPNKALEVEQILKKILPNITIQALKVDDIPELQGEVEEISLGKLKYIRERYPNEGAIIVEDTSLCFEGYKGLPGPYIKDFLNKIGLYGLHKMASVMGETNAYAQCIFALSESKDKEPRLFIGRTHGHIVLPRGPQNFGWDPIFQPEGKENTFAEMSKEEKNEISHRYKALDQLSQYIKSDMIMENEENVKSEEKESH